MNKNPGFGLACDEAKTLLESMIDEMLRINVDPYFPPQNVSHDSIFFHNLEFII